MACTQYHHTLGHLSPSIRGHCHTPGSTDWQLSRFGVALKLYDHLHDLRALLALTLLLPGAVKAFADVISKNPSISLLALESRSGIMALHILIPGTGVLPGST